MSTSRTRSWARLGALLLVIAGLITVPVIPTASAASTTTLNVWTWNVAGNTTHHGAVTSELITGAAGSITSRSIDFAGFNELCWDQYKAIQAELQRRQWPASGDFSRFTELYSGDPNVCGGKPFGDAVFSRQPIATVGRYRLPKDTRKEEHYLSCVTTTRASVVKFCVTHITIDKTYPASGPHLTYTQLQLNAALAQLESFNGTGFSTVVVGDFNAQPSFARMKPWYSSAVNTPANNGNFGAYRELDDKDSVCLGYGEKTVENAETASPCGTGSKIDYLFVRENQIAGSYTADSLAIGRSCTISGQLVGCSDHRILQGTVTVRS